VAGVHEAHEAPLDPELRLQHALDLAYRYLGRRARTEAEVRRQLEDQLVDPDTVEDAVAELVRAGYYRGMVVHRVVPGFVTQFGAPFGDGFGGPPGRSPLRCETSPVTYEARCVGVALSGRDTGSSQLFVTHGLFPHLDGGYALIGTASGPWAAFVDGNLIRDVTVRQ